MSLTQRKMDEIAGGAPPVAVSVYIGFTITSCSAFGMRAYAAP